MLPVSGIKLPAMALNKVDMTFQPDFRRSKAIGRLFQDPLKGTAPNMRCV